MRRTNPRYPNSIRAAFRRASLGLFVALARVGSAFAQGTSPWENAVSVLQAAFTGARFEKSLVLRSQCSARRAGGSGLQGFAGVVTKRRNGRESNATSRA
jgi:hypothetical protein